MNVRANDPAPQDGSAVDKFKQQLESRLTQFAESLPPHISPAYFKGVITWAVMADPMLLLADRVSLFEACLNAANDGLVPDKKEGALVVYNTKAPKANRNDPDKWIKKVQWLPMVRGVITKIYRTDKVKSVSLDIVYGGDEFKYWTDDQGEHLIHVPAESRDKNIVRRVYAMVVMKESEGGGVFAEPLDMDEIDRVRKASKNSEKGPWVDWPEEMWKKTAIKRLAKRLPIARDIQQVLDRDNYLYDLDLKPAIGHRQPMGSLHERLDVLAAGGAQAQLQHQPGETVPMDTQGAGDRQKEPAKKQTQAKQQQAGGQQKSSANPKPPANVEDSEASDPDVASGSDAEGGDDDPLQAAFDAGRQARTNGIARNAVPAEFRNDERLLERYLAGFDGGE
jgi:recombination protein RecT